MCRPLARHQNDKGVLGVLVSRVGDDEDARRSRQDESVVHGLPSALLALH